MGFLDKFRKKPEVTPGGSSVCRHQAPKEQGWRAPQAYGVYAEEVSAHFEKLFPGRETFVYHEILSDLVHIDVNIMQPRDKGGHYILYTTGMSDLPMTLPEEIADHQELKYAELYLFLPGSWNLGKEFTLSDDMPPSSYWPIQMLKFLARFPHEYHTWLGWGHTIPNGPDYAPLYEEVPFGGVVLDQLGKELEAVPLENGKQVNLLLAIPAYRQEIEYKLKYGMEALSDRFSQGELPLELDIHRPNLCVDFQEVLDI